MFTLSKLKQPSLPWYFPYSLISQPLKNGRCGELGVADLAVVHNPMLRKFGNTRLHSTILSSIK